MSNANVLWMLALGGLLIVLPGLNLVGFALFAFGLGSVTERVIGPYEKNKELR